jgi:DNA-binding NarL/FixJ family response regulator
MRSTLIKCLSYRKQQNNGLNQNQGDRKPRARACVNLSAGSVLPGGDMQKSDNTKACNKSEALRRLIHNAAPLLSQLDSSMIFFKHTNFTYADCNRQLVRFSRLSHEKYIIGCEDIELPWGEDHQFYRRIDEQVLAGKETMILMDVRVASGERLAVYQYKKVIRDPVTGEVVGIMAKMQEESNGITEALITIKKRDKELITNLANLPSQYLLQHYSEYGLTTRESECFFYLLRGMTTKMIAQQMSISPRTVENFIEKLKARLNCTYKSDLIQRALDDGLMNIIPPTVNFKLFSESIESL